MSQNNNSNIYQSIGLLVIVILITAASIQLIGFGIDLLRSHFHLSTTTFQEAKTPNIDTPPVSVATTTEEVIAKVKLLSEPYTPSADVLSNIDVYNKEAIVITLNGKFKQAKIQVEGSINGKGDHFAYLNYGDIGGILNATRLSSNTIDKTLTKEQGGVFDSSKPFSFLVDLQGETRLATTRQEFETTRQLVKLVNFWNSNTLPPSAHKLLIAPFNENGEFGGGTITNIEFQYECEVGSSCEVKVCPKGKLATQCLKDYYGVEAAKQWCESSGVKNCQI